MLFAGAKVSHLALLPQGKPEAARRVMAMVREMDRLCFGNCTNEAECEAECPKEISIRNGDEITSPSRRIDLGQICSISNHKS